jgi:hypothetical protein
MPRVLKSMKEATEMSHRHCEYVTSSKYNIPFSPVLSNKHMEKYDEKLNLKDVNDHKGQRKLLLSEIQLLTMYYAKNKVHPTVVYVGSAPGSHLMYLSFLFPGVKFILYDGAPMDNKLRDFPNRYEMYREFFTDEVCEKLKERKIENLLFVSDIRLGSDNKKKFEDQVSRDNEAQLGWAKILKPKYSLLKFRLPFTLKHGQSITYAKGKIMLQMWPPSSSTETRLLVSKANLSVKQEYDFKTYEESLFFHNKYARNYCFPKSVLPKEAAELVSGADNQYCTCYDCMGEIYTFTDYLKLDPEVILRLKASKGTTAKKMHTLKRIVSESMDQKKYGIQPFSFGKVNRELKVIDDVFKKQNGGTEKSVSLETSFKALPPDIQRLIKILYLTSSTIEEVKIYDIASLKIMLTSTNFDINLKQYTDAVIALNEPKTLTLNTKVTEITNTITNTNLDILKKFEISEEYDKQTDILDRDYPLTLDDFQERVKFLKEGFKVRYALIQIKYLLTDDSQTKTIGEFMNYYFEKPLRWINPTHPVKLNLKKNEEFSLLDLFVQLLNLPVEYMVIAGI